MTGTNSNRLFTSVSRAGRARWALAGLLAIAAVPAFAQQAPAMGTSVAATAADVAVTAGTAPSESMSLGDRARILAGDINRLLVPGMSAPATSSHGGSRVQSVLQRALSLLGTPYRWGGTSPDSGFDCSGLVGYVFRNALGIELPRVSRDMAKTGELVASRDSLAEGDLVFFAVRGSAVDHVGIYMGDGRFLHAPRTGRDVTVSSLESGYWASKFLEGRRVAGL